MLSPQGIETQHKAAQLYKAIYDYSDPRVTEAVLAKTVDVNYRIPDQFFPVTSESKIKCGTLLHVSYVKENIKNFELLLKFGAGFTITYEYGSTILHHIVNNIQYTIASSWNPLANSFVNLILSAHVNFANPANPSDKDGLSHFYVAAMANNVEVVKLFIDNGVPIDQSVNMDSPTKPGYAALHFAAEHSCLETVEFLISNGANMHLKSTDGMTPLHLLVKQRLEMVETRYKNREKHLVSATPVNIDLNEKIINVLLENSESDNFGLLKFHAVCTLSKPSAVEYLLEHVDVNQQVNEDSPIWPGYTGLHFAAHCNINMVIILIERGANITTRDAKGTTPLDICMKWFEAEDMDSIADVLPVKLRLMTFSNSRTKLFDCIHALLGSDKLNKFLHDNVNLNLHLPKDSPMWPGSTPLHLAFRFNNKEMLYLLMEIYGRAWKEAVNFSDEDCLTYLHIACTDHDHQHRLAMKILSMKRSVNSMVNAAYKGQPLIKLKPGWTPLHVAVAEGQVSLIKALLERGADVNCKDAEGFSPIHRVFFTNDDKIADLLFASKQLKERVADSAGLTHLHVATWFTNAKAATRLIQMGADIEAKLNLKGFMAGCTALHLAMKTGDPATVKLLLKFGANVLGGASLLSEALTVKSDAIANIFASLISSDEELQKRLREELGLTMLHVACRMLDVDIIETLLQENHVNVNAKTRDDLNFWPGFTPLHVLLESHTNCSWRDRRAFDEALELLLTNGADVTAPNAERSTPVHLAFKMRRSESAAIGLMLMKHQRDFGVNPVNKDGISHLHCACALYDLESVQKFLLQNHADVNRRIDFFARTWAGYSPLHLALSTSLIGSGDHEAQKRVVEFLLAQGANVNVEDSLGYTPLHILIEEMKSPQRSSLMNKILGSSTEVDVNMRTIDGKTPMEICLSTSYKDLGVLLEGVKLLTTHGSRINACNPLNDVGYIALAFSRKNNYASIFPEMYEILLTAETSSLDEMNRNSMHNAVATSYSPLSEAEYHVIILTCICHCKCDIDQRDIFGRTPLHLAIKFRNLSAVVKLLESGADINFVDSTGKSAFSYIFKPGVPVNRTLVTVVALHVQKLKLIGIEVSKLNDSLLTNAVKERFIDLEDRSHNLTGFREKVRKTENFKVGRRGLTLRSFLLETAAINLYPSLTPVERDQVSALFKSFDYLNNPELEFAMWLQWRKVEQRISLIAASEKSFVALLGFPLPDLCVEAVLKFLRNSDLKNLIAAYAVEDDKEMIVD